MSLYNLVQDLPRPDPVESMGLKEPSEAETPKQPTATSKAIDSLAKFIPVEVLAPYAAALSLSGEGRWKSTTVYFIFIAITPLATALFAYATTASTGQEWPKVGGVVWRALAATAAFAVWALAVPLSPFQDSIGGAAVAGFVAMGVSPALTAVDTIIVRIISPKKTPKAK
jgi:hypothetical protein